MSDQLQQEYNAFKTAVQELELRIQQMNMEIDEHKVVLESLRKVQGTRQCKRMIGTVLVDKTVAEVIPELEETLKALTKDVDTMREDLKSAHTRMDAWKKKHNVKVVTS